MAERDVAKYLLHVQQHIYYSPTLCFHPYYLCPALLQTATQNMNTEYFSSLPPQLARCGVIWPQIASEDKIFVTMFPSLGEGLDSTKQFLPLHKPRNIFNI